jgi:hypothetical protein
MKYRSVLTCTMLELLWSALCPFSFTLFRPIQPEIPKHMMDEEWGYFVEIE